MIMMGGGKQFGEDNKSIRASKNEMEGVTSTKLRDGRVEDGLSEQRGDNLGSHVVPDQMGEEQIAEKRENESKGSNDELKGSDQ